MDERAQVVTLHNSTMKIDEIKELLLKKIHHTYLADFIEDPYIDEDKLNILLIIMNNTPLSDKQKRHWIVATMLVQIALDTHELVPVTSSADESEFKTSRSEEHTSELQSRGHLVCRLLLEKKKKKIYM